MSDAVEARPEAASSSSHSSSNPPELLSCVACRSRKLKCDRAKPVCTRCAKVNNECVYPESRRKPAFKRRNVRELEARLAQVEGMLKDVAKPPPLASAPLGPSDPIDDGIPTGDYPLSAQGGSNMWTGGGLDFDPEVAEALFNGDVPSLNPLQAHQPLFASTSPDDSPGGSGGFSSGELLGLGQFETLPPHEMIEELHAIYFRKQQQLIPIVHQGRYLQSFYSVPHMRPPMGLQYAIWMMASHTDEKYGMYHDVFYQRARTYLEHDELKGYGEHFLTVQHAQAWALLSTNEARSMLFTRASMSSARCTKLVMMMGLHRLDDDPEAGERLMAPTLPPPKDWTELEERRRTLWGAFCIDSHASISTGWPNTFDVTEITTRLPSSEEAFNACREEEASTLHDVFNCSEYSIFASAVITCHLFNQILRHVHRPQPDDRPEDLAYGKFWMRHRELDNTLGSAFMFLPERFRLPKYIRNPVAVHKNLNLHAAIICLHHAACDKAERLGLPSHVKKVSLDRLVTAAHEIINIMRHTAHMNSGYRSPLIALSLYCATSVLIYQAKETPQHFDPSSLSFLISCMEAISRDHVITRAYLAQVVRDVKLNPWVANSFDVSRWESLPIVVQARASIPLLARSSVSRHTAVPSPLPGRLLIGAGAGASGCSGFGVGPGPGSQFGRVLGETTEDDDEEDDVAGDGGRPGPKRKRTAGGSGMGLEQSSARTSAAAMPTPVSPASSRTSGAARQAAPGGLWPPKTASAATTLLTTTNQYSPQSAAAVSSGYAADQQQKLNLAHRPSDSSPSAASTSSPATGASGSSVGRPTPGVYYAPVATGGAQESLTGGYRPVGTPSEPGMALGTGPAAAELYMAGMEGQQGQWDVNAMAASMQSGSGDYTLQEQQQQLYAQMSLSGGYGASAQDGSQWDSSGRIVGDDAENWERSAG